MKLRPAEAADRPRIAELHAVNWRNTYRGFLPDDFLAGPVDAYMSERWARQPVAPQDLLLVAEDESGALAGFVALWVQGDTGFIDNLHVAAAGRSRGLGRMLLAAAARHLEAQGITSAYLHVFTGNVRARDLYVALGGQAGEPFDDEIAGHGLPAQRIDWPDVRVLAERASG